MISMYGVPKKASATSGRLLGVIVRANITPVAPKQKATGTPRASRRNIHTNINAAIRPTSYVTYLR